MGSRLFGWHVASHHLQQWLLLVRSECTEVAEQQQQVSHYVRSILSTHVVHRNGFVGHVSSLQVLQHLQGLYSHVCDVSEFESILCSLKTWCDIPCPKHTCQSGVCHANYVQLKLDFIGDSPSVPLQLYPYCCSQDMAPLQLFNLGIPLPNTYYPLQAGLLLDCDAALYLPAATVPSVYAVPAHMLGCGHTGPAPPAR